MRRVYRLLCSGAPVEEVANLMVRAFCASLRDEPEGVLCEFYDALRGALPGAAASFEGERGGGSPDLDFEAVAPGRLRSELGRIASDAALRAWERLNCHAAVGDGEVATAFTEELVRGYAERHCLSCSRTGVAAQRGRSLEGQLRWEDGVWAALPSTCAAPAREMFIVRSGGTIRAPRRSVRPAPMTLERLHQPLDLPPGA